MSCPQPGTGLFPQETWQCLETFVDAISWGWGTAGIWWVEARGRQTRHLMSVHMTTPPATNNDVAQNVSRANAKEPCPGPRDARQVGSEGALLLLCLPSELEMGLTTVKSHWEISPLVQTTLGALRKPGDGGTSAQGACAGAGRGSSRAPRVWGAEGSTC